MRIFSQAYHLYFDDLKLIVKYIEDKKYTPLISSYDYFLHDRIHKIYLIMFCLIIFYGALLFKENNNDKKINYQSFSIITYAIINLALLLHVLAHPPLKSATSKSKIFFSIKHLYKHYKS